MTRDGGALQYADQRRIVLHHHQGSLVRGKAAWCRLALLAVRNDPTIPKTLYELCDDDRKYGKKKKKGEGVEEGGGGGGGGGVGGGGGGGGGDEDGDDDGGGGVGKDGGDDGNDDYTSGGVGAKLGGRGDGRVDGRNGKDGGVGLLSTALSSTSSSVVVVVDGALGANVDVDAVVSREAAKRRARQLQYAAHNLWTL